MKRLIFFILVLFIVVPANCEIWTWRYGTEVDGNSGSHKQVENVQRDINRFFAEHRLKVDGYYGPRTKAAVKEFQRLNDLDDDGVVGPYTMNALYRIYCEYVEK